VRAGRAVAGALGVVALVGTLLVSNDNPGFTAANFFSYFTVESNVLAAIVLLGLAAVPSAAESTEGLRAATTLYMVITGVVYNALLRGVDVGIESTAFGELCNELLHVVVPVALLLDWLLVPPLRRIGRDRALLFLLFPLLYLGYSLARGEITGWYPYPFLNPGDGGYGRVLVYAVVLAVFMLLISLAIEEVGRRATVRAYGAPAAASGGDDPV
jgi:hypothetical protein